MEMNPQALALALASNLSPASVTGLTEYLQQNPDNSELIQALQSQVHRTPPPTKTWWELQPHEREVVQGTWSGPYECYKYAMVKGKLILREPYNNALHYDS